MTIWTDKSTKAVSERALAYVKENAPQHSAEYLEMLESARKWQEEQEARPISQTIGILYSAEQQSRRVMELAWSAQMVARDVKLRYVSQPDVEDIREAITKARYAVIELNEILGLAEVSLGEIVDEKAGA